MLDWKTILQDMIHNGYKDGLVLWSATRMIKGGQIMGDRIIVQLTISGTIELQGASIEGILPPRVYTLYGQALKERRLKKKLTIAKLSQLSGVSISHIYRIESGARSPGGRIIAKLEKVLQDEKDQIGLLSPG